MPSNLFRMDHGRGVTTLLTRQPKIIGATAMVWRDISGKIELDEDINTHPIDDFGLPIYGDFVEPV